MKDNDKYSGGKSRGPKKPGFKKGPFKGRDNRSGGGRDDKPWKKKEWGAKDGDKPRSDKPWGDKPRGDRPRGDKPWGDKPRGDKREGARFEKRPYEKRDDRPRGDRPRDDRPRGDRPWGDKPRSDRPRSDKPWGDKPRGDRPRSDGPRGDRQDRGSRDEKSRGFEKKKFGDKSFGDWRPSRDLRRDDRAERPKKFEKKFDRAERPERVERPDPDSYAQRKSRENRGERLVKARPVRESLPAANIFGFHASRAAWLNPARVIKSIYLTEAGAKTFEDTAREALDAGLSRPIALQVEKDVLDKMLPRDAVHQGVALVAEALDEISVQDFVIAAQAREKTVLVMLDQVTDPHNVGAIIRSACAFGAAGMIMQKMHAPEMEGTLLKSASGAAEHMPVAYETNLSRAIEELKEGGFFVIGLAEEGEKDLATLARTAGGKIVLVMGSEGAGMRRLVREHCDALAHLPVTGPVKSLNVSNAAAVALYAVTQG